MMPRVVLLKKVNQMNILIPTDLSEASLEKLPYIIRLFANVKADITLFHAVEPVKAGSALVLNVDDIIFEESKTTMDNFVDQVRRDLSSNSTSIQPRISFGYFETTLNHALKDIRPDLVIMNSKSRTGIDKIFDRKKTLQFIGEMKQPLLIIPNNMDYDAIRLIGVAVNQQEPLSNETTKKLTYLADGLGAELNFFHIINPSESSKSSYVPETPIVNQKGGLSVLEHEEVPIGIETWMTENNAEVLAMVTHSKSFFERLFKNRMTHIMAKRNSNMLLILSQ